jgi:hypothetical protein
MVKDLKKEKSVLAGELKPAIKVKKYLKGTPTRSVAKFEENYGSIPSRKKSKPSIPARAL